MDSVSLDAKPPPESTMILTKQPLSYHKLKTIQFQIVKDDPVYPGLRKLKLKGRDLEYLPNELFTLTDIEVLDLSPEREACLFYQLVEVPPAISRLSNLKVLMLDTNDLRDLPAELCKLGNLERLSLSNNSLQSLPSSFGSLSKLKSLHLSNNDLGKVPAEVLKLKELEFLDLSDNGIATIPGGISSLTNLRTLLLFLNKLTVLPDAICELVQLRSLWIGGNNIKKLPSAFGKLKLLDWGVSGHHTVSAVLSGNPLTDPPPEICLRGIGAIAEYLATRKNTDQRKAPPARR